MTSLFSSFDLYLQIFSMISLWFSVLLSTLAMKSNLINLNLKKSLEMFFSAIYNLNYSKWPKNLLYFNYSTLIVIFIMNYLSVFSWLFPMTSQIWVVMSLSMSIWIFINLFGIKNNYNYFLAHLTPEGSPTMLSVGLVLIEMVSSLIRPITLTVRLCSNIMSGHLLMLLMYMFVSKYWYMFSFLYVGLTVVEMLVSFIQSYIYIVLISLYFSDL